MHSLNKYQKSYEKMSLREIASMYIREKILSGELKVGDRLIEADIAQKLNISRAPVREAMRELNILGIVSFEPRKCNQIIDLSCKEVIEIFEIRTALEKQIYHILIQGNLLNDQDFDNLDDSISRFRNQNDDSLNAYERNYLLNTLDIEFHRYLWKKAGSPKREYLLESLFLQLVIVMNKDITTFGEFEEKANEHELILSALKTKDESKSCEMLETHMENYIDALID